MPRAEGTIIGSFPQNKQTIGNFAAGVPVSEDALLIFVGTLLGNPDFTRRHKAACVAWCYAGVVLSDLVSLAKMKKMLTL